MSGEFLTLVKDQAAAKEAVSKALFQKANAAADLFHGDASKKNPEYLAKMYTELATELEKSNPAKFAEMNLNREANDIDNQNEGRIRWLEEEKDAHRIRAMIDNAGKEALAKIKDLKTPEAMSAGIQELAAKLSDPKLAEYDALNKERNELFAQKKYAEAAEKYDALNKLVDENPALVEALTARKVLAEAFGKKPEEITAESAKALQITADGTSGTTVSAFLGQIDTATKNIDDELSRIEADYLRVGARIYRLMNGMAGGLKAETEKPKSPDPKTDADLGVGGKIKTGPEKSTDAADPDKTAAASGKDGLDAGKPDKEPRPLLGVDATAKLGISLEDHTKIGFGWGGRVKTNEGANIFFIDPASPVKGVLNEREKITRVGEYPVTDAASCKAALEKYRGQKVKISIVEPGFLGRPGNRKVVEITIPS